MPPPDVEPEVDGPARRGSPRVPAAVWWLCGLQLLLLVGQALLVPTWRGPDEPNHVDLVVALRDDWHYPAYDERDMDPGLLGSLGLFHFGRDARNLREDGVSPRSHRLTRSDLEAKGAGMDLRLLGRPGVRNHMPQHPPGYYLLVAGLATAVDRVVPGHGLGSVDQEVGTFRLLSLLAAVPLPLVAWWVARGAGVAPAGALAAAVVPLAVPQLTHIAAVVNSDALLVLLCGVLTGIVLRVAQGAVDLRTMAVAGAVTGAALFVKALAFVLPAWVLVAFVVGWRRAERPKHLRCRWRIGRAPWLAPLGVYAVVTVVAGGWWWIRNLFVYGDISPSIEYSTRLSVASPDDAPGAIDWGRWASDMIQRYWGTFGWIDVDVPETAVVIATVVVVAGVALALIPRWRRRPTANGLQPEISAETSRHDAFLPRFRSRGPAGSLTPATVALLVAPTVLLTAFVAANTYRLYQPGRVLAMVQGRYLFGGLIGLAVVVAAGWSRLGRRWTPVAFLMAGLALQGSATVAMLRYWWGPPRGSLGDQLDALAAWSPWPAGVVGIVVGLILGVAGVTVWAVAREGWPAPVGAAPAPEAAAPRSPITPAGGQIESSAIGS